MNKTKLSILLFFLLASHYPVDASEHVESTMPSISRTGEESIPSAVNSRLKVAKVQNKGFTLILNDGSEWGVDSVTSGTCSYLLLPMRVFDQVVMGQQNDVSDWEAGDCIAFRYADGGNFFQFHLIVENVSKDEWTLVRLTKAPDVDNPDCVFVQQFDPETGLLLLSDGSRCRIKLRPRGPRHLLYGLVDVSSPERSWEVGDPITLLEGYVWNHHLDEMEICRPAS